MPTLNGKTALVTGAARGIGKAIATALANEGAHVIVHDLHEEEGTTLATQLGGTFLKADLTSMDETRALAHRALQVHLLTKRALREAEGGELEGVPLDSEVKGIALKDEPLPSQSYSATSRAPIIDILINNAGFQTVSAIEDFDEQTWANMIQVMLVAPFQLTKWLLPGMKTRGWGRIVNISSIHGLVASPYKSAYVSAKHGLLGLTKTVALEAAAHGVTCNAICPAYVRTGLVEAQIAAQSQALGIPEADVVDQVMLEPAAIKRLVEPDEVANLALFLISDAARSITGSAYEMDLGWTAR